MTEDRGQKNEFRTPNNCGATFLRIEDQVVKPSFFKKRTLEVQAAHSMAYAILGRVERIDGKKAKPCQ